MLGYWARVAAGVVLLAGGLSAGTGPVAAQGVSAAHPEAVALATARRTGQRVEVVEQRTPTRRIFANPSGTMTLEQRAPDSSHAGPQYRWTHVNKADPDHFYWDNDRADGARVGVSPKGVFRSLFQMDTTPIAGAKVYQATFRINLDHSNFCRETPVDLWHTKPIDPAVPLTWNSSREHWLGGGPLATVAAQSCEPTTIQPMEFATEALRAVAQRAADDRTGFVTLGLRAPDERDWRQGKRFLPDSALIAITYNNPPNAPTVITSFPTACGTAAAPTPVSASTSRNYSGSASDPDRDNITTRLEILRADGTIAHASEVGPTTSGTAFSWPEVPAGILVHGETYHYRAVSRDSLDSSPYTRECYFTVDAIRPGVPRISSSDYPDGEPVILARTTGTVTLRPAASDTDVAEYVFGFQAETVTARIKAGPDGTAVLPVTVKEDPITGIPGSRLFVRSVDAAGNQSLTTPAWDLQALENPAPQAHVRGDATGDGRADVTTVLGHDFGRTTVWNITARDGGFHAGYMGFDTGVGGFGNDRIRPVRGDFDGDGRADVAMFHQRSDGSASLIFLRSDGNRYGAPPPVWDSGTEPWPLDAVRVLSGDVNGDGKSDIVAQRVVPGGWKVLVFPGGALGTPVTWFETTGDWRLANVVAGDVDGDGLTDLIEMRGQGNCQTSNWVYRSSGTAFGPGELRWDSGPGGYCADRSTPVTGDVDGDGRDDIVAMIDNGGSDTAIVVFTSASGLTPQQWWREPGEFEAGRARLSTGDFDLDGKDDLAVVYSCCAAGETQLWTLRSTGTAFAGRVLGWQEVAGGVPAR